MTIFKGESKKLIITVLDKDSNPEDLTALLNYMAILYYPNGTIIDKYIKDDTGLTGFLDTIAEDEVNGKFAIIMEADRTAEINVGEVLLDVKILGTDAEFDDGKFRLVDSGVEVDEIKDSPSKDDLLT